MKKTGIILIVILLLLIIGAISIFGFVQRAYNSFVRPTKGSNLLGRR